MSMNEQRGVRCCTRLVDTWKNKKWKLIEVEFLVIATMGTVILGGYSSKRIDVLRAQGKPVASEIVMLLSEVFSLFYIYHGIIYAHFNEIIFYIIATLLDNIYCTIDFDGMKTPGTFEKVRLGLDWTFGCVLPCIVGYLVIRSYLSDVPRRTVNRNDCFYDLLVFDLQLQVSSAVFIMTDGQVEVGERVVLGLGLLFTFAFFCIGQLLTCCGDGTCPRLVLMCLGLTTLLTIIYKTIKQKDGIASGVYQDVMSLVFSLLATIIRFVVLGLGCCLEMGTDEETQPLQAVAYGENGRVTGGPAPRQDGDNDGTEL